MIWRSALFRASLTSPVIVLHDRLADPTRSLRDAAGEVGERDKQIGRVERLWHVHLEAGEQGPGAVLYARV